MEYRRNDLFRDGDHWELNACIGTNGGPYGFVDYSLGYFEAGMQLVEVLIKDSGVRGSIDILVYPLVYNFRHAIELGLKHLAQTLPCLSETPGGIQLTHNLKDNWIKVRKHLEMHPQLLGTGEEIRFIDDLLMDLCELDPKGEVFRFPSDTKGNLFLQEFGRINVYVFGQYLGVAKGIFEDWFSVSRFLWETQQEMNQAYR